MNDKLLNMLGLAKKAGKIQLGVFCCMAAMEKNKAKLIIVSTDIGNSNNKMLTSKCSNLNIPIIHYATKERLGKAVGKDSLVSIAVCDENFAGALLKIYGGEVND